jgi:hypothetical protein
MTRVRTLLPAGFIPLSTSVASTALGKAHYRGGRKKVIDEINEALALTYSSFEGGSVLGMRQRLNKRR